MIKWIFIARIATHKIEFKMYLEIKEIYIPMYPESNEIQESHIFNRD